jgi:hypothetical protein
VNHGINDAAARADTPAARPRVTVLGFERRTLTDLGANDCRFSSYKAKGIAKSGCIDYKGRLQKGEELN